MLSKISNYLVPQKILLLVVILGAVLRITVFLQNRSFILDEANLARNIVEKSYAGFFQALDYEQYSPPLFSSALKTMTKLFGVNEYSLTLISLLAGIGCLVLMMLIGKQLKIKVVPLIYLLVLFGFSPLAIRYSTELKQYSLDAFLCLLFVFWMLKIEKESFNISHVLRLTILGSIVIWMSMPIVFVLAAIGVHLFFRWLKTRSFHFSNLVIIGCCWLLSFGVYFFTILKSDAGSDYLQNFHSRYFFDLIPTDRSALVNNYNLILGLLRSVTDKTTVSLIAAFVFVGLGMYQLIKNHKTAASLLLLPILFCLIASHLKMYSLLTRLTLFLIPLLSLVFAYGFSWIWNRSNRIIKALLVIFALLSLVNKKGYEYFYSPLEVEDSKTTLNYLKENIEEAQPIFVHHAGVPAFIFYNEMHDQAFGFEHYHFGHWSRTLGQDVQAFEALNSGDQFWLFFSHTEPVSQLNKDFGSIEKMARKLEEHRAEQSILQSYILH